MNESLWRSIDSKWSSKSPTHNPDTQGDGWHRHGVDHTSLYVAFHTSANAFLASDVTVLSRVAKHNGWIVAVPRQLMNGLHTPRRLAYKQTPRCRK